MLTEPSPMVFSLQSHRLLPIRSIRHLPLMRQILLLGGSHTISATGEDILVTSAQGRHVSGHLLDDSYRESRPTTDREESEEHYSARALLSHNSRYSQPSPLMLSRLHCRLLRNGSLFLGIARSLIVHLINVRGAGSCFLLVSNIIISLLLS